MCQLSVEETRERESAAGFVRLFFGSISDISVSICINIFDNTTLHLIYYVRIYICSFITSTKVKVIH